jgi:photosystem II stability/assembly factor-like uncharacterized protein
MMKCLLPLILVAAAAAQHVSVPTSSSLRGLSVVSDKIIWASGTEGAVIRTTDGGKNWSVMTVPGAEKLDFRGIRAFDANTALIISSGPAEKGQARIYRTADGGKNWTHVYEQKTPGIFFDAIAFWDHKNGIVLSDPVEGHFALFSTEDGGSTWKQIAPRSLPAALPGEGAFAASNSCLMVQGKADVWFATGGASVARVFHSGDRGKTWTVAETPMHPRNSSSGIFSLAFLNSREGVAVGGDYQHPESSDLPNVLRTSDGGKTWGPGEPTQPAGAYLSSAAVLVLPAKTDFVFVGISGMFMHTILSPQVWGRVETENLNAVAIAPTDKGCDIWAIGAKGLVLIKEMMFLEREKSAVHR